MSLTAIQSPRGHLQPTSTEAVPAAEGRDARVAVVTRDASESQTIRGALGRLGVASVACHRGADLARLLAEGLGAAVIDAAALDEAGLKALVAALGRQPHWSDVPLIVLTDGELHFGGRLAAADVKGVLGESGNATVLERPVALGTLLSTVGSALRSRRRQYEARRLMRRLEEGVAERDHLLAMLGHELRNPLAAIRAATELLIREEAAGSSPKTATAEVVSARRHHLQLIARQGGQLVRMVDDLLDLNLLRSGRVRLRRAPLDLNDIVRRCVDSAQDVAARRDQRLLVSPSRVPAVVMGDPDRLEQALSSLLANATKYSSDGASILLSVSTEAAEAAEAADAGGGGTAVVRIADSGIGMSPEVIRGVFDLFTQADRSIDRAAGGLGLGLPLVQALIEGHGGTVTAASEGPGRGSVFTVRLPLAAVQPAAAAKDQSAGVGSMGPETPPCGRHVLLVEDQGDMRDVMARLLRSWGHRVETAASGPAGVAVALSARPEVALVDVGLPGLSGYEVAARLRRAMDGSIRLIALTGYGAPEDRRRSAEAGFDLHLVKPVDFEQLKRLLAE